MCDYKWDSFSSNALLRNLASRPLLLLSGINIEHNNDNEQENYFQQREVGWIEASRFVVSVLENDERGERNRGREPDGLAFGIPHKSNFEF